MNNILMKLTIINNYNNERIIFSFTRFLCNKFPSIGNLTIINFPILKNQVKLVINDNLTCPIRGLSYNLDRKDHPSLHFSHVRFISILWLSDKLLIKLCAVIWISKFIFRLCSNSRSLKACKKLCSNRCWDDTGMKRYRTGHRLSDDLVNQAKL